MSQSTGKARRRKPDRPPRPYAEFPLYAHPLGYWTKKVNGKLLHFGRWGRVVNGVVTRLEDDGWEAALRVYKARVDDAAVGRIESTVVTEERPAAGLTVMDLCNKFLNAKLRKKDAGELAGRSFVEYRQTCEFLAATLGKDRLVESLVAEDFEALRAAMTKRWGPVRVGNAITRVKTVFKYGTDNGLIERAVRYGSEFKKPGKAVLRRHKATNGQRMIEAADLRRLIDGSLVVGENGPELVSPAPALKAMILLGLNCGFGNTDCATLPVSAIDLDAGWVDFPRPKTGIPRRAPLWPETVEALRAAIATRPQPRDEADAGLALLMPNGRRWVRETKRSTAGALSDRFAKLLKACGLYREGIGFYTLRHVFRTVADSVRDPVAIDLIMGHADHTMGGHYRERVDDSRLRAVTDHVHGWLWPKPEKKAEAPKTEGGAA